MEAFAALGVGALVLGSSFLASALRTEKESEDVAAEETEPWQQTMKRVQFSPNYLPQGQTVPFRLLRDNIIIPLKLNGDSQMTCWIVDSGYGYTAIDNSVYKRLNLRPEGTMALETLQTDKLIKTTVPPGLVYDFSTQRPILESPPHTAVVRKLKNTLEDTWGNSQFCNKPGGILGITWLKRFVTRIDYKKKNMTFYDPSTFAYNGDGMVFRDWLDIENYFLVPLTIDGVTSKVALDTGAFATIMTKGFLRLFQKAKGVPFGFDGDQGSVSASFSEQNIDLKRKIMPRVFLGNAMINNAEILFPPCNDTVCPGLLESTNRFDGLLGHNLLQLFVIYIVYQPVPYCIFEPIRD